MRVVVSVSRVLLMAGVYWVPVIHPDAGFLEVAGGFGKIHFSPIFHS